MVELEARKQQANKKQCGLREEVTQLQESMEKLREKVEQLEEAAANASNCISATGLACHVAVLEEQSCVKREFKGKSGIHISKDGEMRTRGVCSVCFSREVMTPWLSRLPAFHNYRLEEWPRSIRD